MAPGAWKSRGGCVTTKKSARLCKFFEKGQCKRGAQCPFLHRESAAAAPSINIKTKELALEAKGTAAAAAHASLAPAAPSVGTKVVTVPCRVCEGEGQITVVSPTSYEECQTCQGTGYVQLHA